MPPIRQQRDPRRSASSAHATGKRQLSLRVQKANPAYLGTGPPLRTVGDDVDVADA